MDFDTITKINLFIDSLDGSKKKSVAMNLFLNMEYNFFFVNDTVFAKNTKTNQVQKFRDLINLNCNC